MESLRCFKFSFNLLSKSFFAYVIYIIFTQIHG